MRGAVPDEAAVAMISETMPGAGADTTGVSIGGCCTVCFLAGFVTGVVVGIGCSGEGAFGSSAGATAGGAGDCRGGMVPRGFETSSGAACGPTFRAEAGVLISAEGRAEGEDTDGFVGVAAVDPTPNWLKSSSTGTRR